MKFKITLVAAALMIAGNAFAAESESYYKVEVLSSASVLPSDANYGPYPSAISPDGLLSAAHSFRSSLSQNVDVGLPFTFNKQCQYDDDLCYFEFQGSNSETQKSYENAYEKWREDFVNNTSTQHLFSQTASLDASTNPPMPSQIASGVDLKITAVSNNGSYVGYFNALDDKTIRTAFYVDGSGSYHKLLTAEGDNKFNSAYDIKVLEDGNTYIVGTGSTHQDNGKKDSKNNYHDECYSGGWDYAWTKGDLTYCPGYNTKAYFWDVSSPASNEITGKLLASWISSDSDSYNATALAINNQGVVIGVSSKNVGDEYNTNDPYNPQRAIIMNVTKPSGAAGTELHRVMNDIGEEGLIYNTWAVSISDTDLATNPAFIVGNREYATEKGRNQPVEFFITDSEQNSISIPLKDKKVMTTKNRGDNPSKSGANSRAYDSAMILKEGSTTEKDLWVIGEVDDYDQTNPVTDGSPRGQSAFLYQKSTNTSWRINDLICPEQSGKVVCEPIRVRSARAISDDGSVIIAEGFKYTSIEEFQYMTNGTPVVVKLTRNTSVKTPNDSPNAWDSKLYENVDGSYERQGAGISWSVFLLLPMLFIRRFSTK